MPKIKNPEYKQFIEHGYIELIEEPKFLEYLDQIKNKKLPRKCDLKQARALFICLWYTGRRPSEIANIKAEDVEKIKEKHKYYIKIKYQTLKKGLKNTIWLPYNKTTKEMYLFMINRLPQMYCFWSFRSLNKATTKWKVSKQILVKENGKLHKEEYTENKQKQYIRTGKKIDTYCKEWTGLPAYFFRHNRFSLMYSKGATDSQVQLFKGAKSPGSVQMYKHMSKQMAKDITKLF
jgi:integrase